jgi:hypothetical protein
VNSLLTKVCTRLRSGCLWTEALVITAGSDLFQVSGSTEPFCLLCLLIIAIALALRRAVSVIARRWRLPVD